MIKNVRLIFHYFFIFISVGYMDEGELHNFHNIQSHKKKQKKELHE